MALIQLSLALNPATLLRRATRGLFPLATPSAERPWPTLSAWLLLRQGGLRDDLHRFAADAGVAGWFDPPVCLFAELADRWSTSTSNPLSDAERIALLTAVVARHAAGVFDRGGSSDAWIPTIDRLLGELLSEGVAPETFALALGQRADRDDFEHDRDERLAAILADWTFTLRQQGRVDGRDALARLARFISTDPTGFAARLGGRRDVRIVGLADLRGGWRRLLSALHASDVVDSVTILASHALDLSPSLHAVVEPDDESEGLAARLFTTDAPGSAAITMASATTVAVQLLDAPDTAREIEHVAVRVRALLDAGGSSPARIAVVVRQARPGVDRVAEALQTVGVPVTARRRAALSESGPARALHALLSAATAGFSAHALIELAQQPLLTLAFDVDVLRAAGAPAPVTTVAQWEVALRALLERCHARDLTPHHWRAHGRLPTTERTSDTLDAWLRWLPFANRLTIARTDSEWFELVQHVLTAADWGVSTQLQQAPTDAEQVWRADVRAVERMALVADEWARALRELQIAQSPTSAESFARRLSLVLDADVITPPETGFGVVVAEALAAGWRTFDHVFLVGLSSGDFPRRPPPSALLTDRDRHALVAAGLELDAPDMWRVRERELFRVLCAAPTKSLTLSWSSMNGDGREVARSPFADEVIAHLLEMRSELSELQLEHAGILQRVGANQVLTPGFPLADFERQALLTTARRSAAIEHTRTRNLSAFNGAIESESALRLLALRYGEPYNWSATQLETLAKCQWSWFASRALELQPSTELDSDMEPTTRGILLHDALRRFLERVRAERNGPAFLLAPDLTWGRPLLNASLDDAWTALATTTWLGDETLHEITRAEVRTQLQQYLDFEVGLNEKSFNNRTNASRQIRMGMYAGEVEFSNVELHADGVRFRLRGSIDRLDRGSDDRIPDAPNFIAAIDYKSTKSSTPAAGHASGWDDGVVLQVPLYAAALRQIEIDGVAGQLARSEYRTLTRPESVHSLQFVAFKTVGKARALVPDPEAEATLQQALGHAARRIRHVRHGEFATNPAASCGCSPYCVARDICRIPGGPIEAEP